jgi:hypothetical protein
VSPKMRGRKKDELVFENVEQKLTPAEYSATGLLEDTTMQFMDCDEQSTNNCFFTAVFFILVSMGCKKFKDDLQFRKHCVSSLIMSDDEGDDFKSFLSELEVENKAEAVKLLSQNSFIDTISGFYLLSLTELDLPHITTFVVNQKKGRSRVFHGQLTFTGNIDKVAAIVNLPYTKNGKTNNHFANVLIDHDFFPPFFEHWAKQKLPEKQSRKNSKILQETYPHLHKDAWDHYGRMSLDMAHRCILDGITKGPFNEDGTYKNSSPTPKSPDEEEAIKLSLLSKEEEDRHRAECESVLNASRELAEAEALLNEAINDLTRST